MSPMSDPGNLPTEAKESLSRATVLSDSIRSVFRPVDRGRLLTDIEVVNHDLRRRVGVWQSCSELQDRWAREVCELLEQASTSARRFDTEGAWARLDAARRAAIPGYEPEELRNLATALRKEAAQKETLKGSWRAKAIDALLDSVSDIPQEGVAAARLALRDAVFIRDEALRNNYRKIVLLRRKLAVLMAFLVSAVAALLSLQAWWPVELEAISEGGWRVWAHVVVWGILGGSITAVLSVIRNSLQRRVPEQLREGVITSIRPILGAAGALAAYVLVRAKTLGIDVTTNAGVFAVAFAAGFSEALIVRAVGAVSGREGS